VRTFYAALATVLLVATVHAAPAWQRLGDDAYLCGGVGKEEMQSIEAEKPHARLAVLLSTGISGEFISDATLGIGGDQLDTPLLIPSTGPLCLFKLRPGRYTVTAEHGGETRSRDIELGTALQSIHFRFEH